MNTENVLLCIEDNESNLHVVKRVASHIGMEFISAKSAEEGLELAETHQPAVILMDVVLPGIDGITATRMLKENPSTTDIPVIIVTGSDDVNGINCAEIGCLEVIKKPLKLDKLMVMLHRHKL